MTITTERRQQIEDAVILHAMKLAEGKGWDLLGASDGEEFGHTPSKTECLDITRSVDESWVYFVRQHSNGTSSRASMYLVRGNDGPDVIADHSIAQGFGEIMDQVYEWAGKQFDSEVYGI